MSLFFFQLKIILTLYSFITRMRVRREEDEGVGVVVLVCRCCEEEGGWMWLGWVVVVLLCSSFACRGASVEEVETV